MPNPVCASCGTTMVSGPFPAKFTCPNCDSTEVKKKTPEERKAAGKKAAATKKSGGKGGKK